MSRPLGSRYRIEDLLGQGGMGEVYRGQDETGAPVAIKLLRPHLTTDPELVVRFVRERNTLLRVRHPNVVTVLDLVVEGPTLAIVMELVPGTDLRARLRAEPISPAEATRLAAGIAEGLAAVHRSGYVHRDVKPENVLLDSRATPVAPRLTDFGIARVTATTSATPTALIGTPYYLAPELWAGRHPTPQSDLYALGILLFELCCGVPPYTGTPFAVMSHHLEYIPGRPDGIPDQLWDVISRLVAREPTERPDDAAQVAARLNTLIPGLSGAAPAPRISSPPAPTWSGPNRPPPAEVTDSAAGPAAVPPTPTPPSPSPPSDPAPPAAGRRGPRWVWPAAAVAAAVLLGAGGAWALTAGGGGDHRAGPAVSTNSPSSSPTSSPSSAAPPSTSANPSATSFVGENPSARPTPGGPGCAASSPPTAPNVGTILSVEDHADQCRLDTARVQQALRDKGYRDDPPTGYYDTKTREQVSRFQSDSCPSSASPMQGVTRSWTWNKLVNGTGPSCPPGS